MMMLESVLLGLFCVFWVYAYISQYKSKEAEKRAKRAAERQQQLIFERRLTEEAWINLFNLLNDEFIHSFHAFSSRLNPESVEISADKKGEVETDFVKEKLNFIFSDSACREKIAASLQEFMEKRKTEQEKIFRQYQMLSLKYQQKNLKNLENPAMDFFENQKFETEMQGRLNEFYQQNQKLINETLKIKRCQEIWSINLVTVKNVIYQPRTKTYLIKVTLRDDK